MSERARELFEDDLEAMGPIRVSEVDKAQKEIMRIARRLSGEGEWMKGSKSGDLYVAIRVIENPLFEKGLPITGFKKQPTDDDIQVGDVLLFQSTSGNLDHVAVFIGDNMILNHNIRRLSCREPFDLNYQRALKGVYRYEA